MVTSRLAWGRRRAWPRPRRRSHRQPPRPRRALPHPALAPGQLERTGTERRQERVDLVERAEGAQHQHPGQQRGAAVAFELPDGGAVEPGAFGHLGLAEVAVKPALAQALAQLLKDGLIGGGVEGHDVSSHL
jgi:hypothetical protein